MADFEIGFAQLGLASILKHNQLVVPPNQRDYSWTVKEVRTLLQDFAKSISEGDAFFAALTRARGAPPADRPARAAWAALRLLTDVAISF